MLQESYAVERIIEYYVVGILFNASQYDNETATQWGTQFDLIRVDPAREAKTSENDRASICCDI